MTGTFLDKILEAKRAEVARFLREINAVDLKESAFTVRRGTDAHRLRSALQDSDRVNIVAEIKRASPSKGEIAAVPDVAALAANYEKGGAPAISVLTDTTFFHGSPADLKTVRAAVDVPILRKDFIVDERQIYQSAAIGADAVLLIVAALSEPELGDFLRIARDELGMDAVIEVHDAAELEIAGKAGADIIGVNNRDLRSFDVSLDVSRRLIDSRPAGAMMVAESGISDAEQIAELRSLGFEGFLIGEALMRSGDPVAELRRLRGV